MPQVFSPAGDLAAAVGPFLYKNDGRKICWTLLYQNEAIAEWTLAAPGVAMESP
jgi:hypothetical protein